MKIAVAGLGYVGLSNAILLAQNNEVVATDISPQKVDAINSKNLPISDAEMEKFLHQKKLNLYATTSSEVAYENADFIIIATPTDYNDITDFFDTSSVEGVISDVLRINPDTTIIIKSTVPVGFVKKMRSQHKCDKIIFSPEFLREGSALTDNLYPNRIIVGDTGDAAKCFADLLLQGAKKNDVPILLTDPNEAEAIKLFSNTYLAMRVAYFNELDSYAIATNMNTRQIIDGMSLDPRIGSYYNNPSFGYGGYCLPKDTKQLLANFKGVPQNLIRAIVDANQTRINFLADQIIALKPNTLGVHRLVMKTGSDNFRQSSVIGIINRVKSAGINIIIYEPVTNIKSYEGCEVIADLENFKNTSDLIISNRLTTEINDVMHKVFTRDLYNEN